MRKWALGSIWLYPLPCQPWPAVPSFAKLAYSQHSLVSCSSLCLHPPAQTSWGLCWPRLFPSSPQILAFPNSFYLWVRLRASSGWGQSPPTLPSPRSWLRHTPGLGQIQPQGDTPCKARFTAARTSPSGWGRRGLSQRLKVQPDSQLPFPVWSLPQLHAWFVGVCTEIALIFHVSAWLGSGCLLEESRDTRSPSLPAMVLPPTLPLSLSPPLPCSGLLKICPKPPGPIHANGLPSGPQMSLERASKSNGIAQWGITGGWDPRFLRGLIFRHPCPPVCY